MHTVCLPEGSKVDASDNTTGGYMLNKCDFNRHDPARINTLLIKG